MELTVLYSEFLFRFRVAMRQALHRPGSVEALDAQQGAIGLTKLSRVGDDTSHPRIARTRRQFVKQFVKCHALDELLVLDFVDGSVDLIHQRRKVKGLFGYEVTIRSHDTKLVRKRR